MALVALAVMALKRTPGSVGWSGAVADTVLPQQELLEEGS
jgi:hypothetical protein